MLQGIDHLVIAVPDLDAAADTLERELGITIGPGGRHDRWGTLNRLGWLGDTYLELIGVFDEALARGSWIGKPTLELLERGQGLVTFVLATDALETDADLLRARGAGLGAVMPGERLRPDGRTVRWTLAGPPALGPTAPFLIEHDATAAEWTPAERAERAVQLHPAGGPVRLEALELPVDDVNRAFQSLLRVAGLRFRPSLAGRGARDADVGRQIVRILPRAAVPRAAVPRAAGEGDGSGAAVPHTVGQGAVSAVVRLAGPDLPDRTVDALGCRWILRPG